ncbi:MAG: GatB/YqeY domain-containing protein [Gammaproteobacteria bacterium]|nr:GatB/YqeY domain-containing protein [Gammaproteobacteria bacterium]
MDLKTRINEAVKDAMRARDKPRLGALRLIMAEIKRVEVDERIEVDDARVLVILDKMLKQRAESERQYRDADRTDLADVEAFEIALIREFMPAPLAEAEIDSLIEAALTESGADDMRAMGKVMAILKPKLQGRADMAAVSARVKARLA